MLMPFPVAARSKAWVCGRLFTGIASSSPAGEHGSLSVVSVVCCQVEVSATGRSLVQRSRTGCGVSVCDCEAPIMRRSRPNMGVGGGKESSMLLWWLYKYNCARCIVAGSSILYEAAMFVCKVGTFLPPTV